MRINLISQGQYDLLKAIQQRSPILTFQNVGFQYIDKSKFTESDKKDFETVKDILRKAIVGFTDFNNFCHTKNGELRLRFHYDWTADDRSQGISFTGVGYILCDELLHGFQKSIKFESTL